MPMIRPGFLSSAERLELEACVRRQREDHGIGRCCTDPAGTVRTALS